MASRWGATVLDSDGDRRQFSFNGITLTAGNFAAQIAAMEALSAAVQAILLGNIIVDSQIANYDVNANQVPPADHMAQVHTKWLFTYKNSVTNAGPYHTSVPAANYDMATNQDLDGNFYVDLSVGAGLALKTAFDAYVKDPVTGQAMSLIDVRPLED